MMSLPANSACHTLEMARVATSNEFCKCVHCQANIRNGSGFGHLQLVHENNFQVNKPSLLF
jgi:hypothetical protein